MYLSANGPSFAVNIRKSVAYFDCVTAGVDAEAEEAEEEEAESNRSASSAPQACRTAVKACVKEGLSARHQL